MQAIIPKQNRWLSKKRVLLTLLALALITSVIIIVLGHLQWQREVASNEAVLRHSSTLFKEVGEADARTKRIIAAKELASIRMPDCNGQWWYSWQAGLPTPARHSQSKCHDVRKSISGDVALASKLVAYLDGEEKIITILSGLQINSKNKDWQQVASTAALKTQQSINKIKPETYLKKVHKTAQERVGAIVKAWVSLDSASKKQDRTAYEKANESLDQAYANLSLITDAADAQVILLALPFNSGVRAA